MSAQHIPNVWYSYGSAAEETEIDPSSITPTGGNEQIKHLALEMLNAFIIDPSEGAQEESDGWLADITSAKDNLIGAINGAQAFDDDMVADAVDAILKVVRVALHNNQIEIASALYDAAYDIEKWHTRMFKSVDGQIGGPLIHTIYDEYISTDEKIDTFAKRDDKRKFVVFIDKVRQNWMNAKEEATLMDLEMASAFDKFMQK